MNRKRMIVLVMTLAMTLTLCACGTKSLVGSYSDGLDYYAFDEETYTVYTRYSLMEEYEILDYGTYTLDGDILRLYPGGFSRVVEYTVVQENDKLSLYTGGSLRIGTVYDKVSDKCIPPEDLNAAGNIFSDASDTF